MSKITKIDPRGMLNTMNYVSDYAGCGFIRGVLPSDSINSWRYKNLQFNYLTSAIFMPDPSLYKHMTYTKFQRSATESQLNIIKYYISHIKKETGTPVIYESDDHLFNIPESNFAHDYYMKNANYIKEMLSIVDGITVSTAYLKKCYSKYNSNISVVKNRLCKYLWGDVIVRNSFENVGDKFRIVYPGSQNHFSCDPNKPGGDIGPLLMDFIKKTTDKYDWIFIGGIPNELKMLAKEGKITYMPWVNILEYPKFFKKIKADIAIAPLEVNDFNRGKSNLKMLEYTICGLPGIYTNVEPYRYAKNTADTEEYFIHLIEMLESNVSLREKSWQKDYSMVKSDLYFEDNRIKWINEHLKLFNKRLG